MKWVLWIALANYASGPVPVDETTCRQVVSRWVSGRPVIIEMEDDTKRHVRRAICIRILPTL